MRTLLGHPEPPRGTVYVSTGTTGLPLENTLIDVRPSTLFPINRTASGQTATTRGWIRLNLNY